MFAVWVCGILVVSAFVMSAGVGNDVEGKEFVKDGTMYTSHAPIYISGDADFATQADVEGWPGNGTSWNPYIIGGYVIDGSVDWYCIGVEFTSVYFAVKDSYLHSTIAGIYLDSVQNGTVDNNTIMNNEYGIYLYNATGITVTRNNVFSNIEYGIYIEVSSGNTIYHNNFISNVNQAYGDGANQWHNDYPDGGNYWDDYTGIDNFSGPGQNESGPDGFGDISYANIGGGMGAQDNYPLMQPWNPASQHVPHKPIRINSNAEFTSANGVMLGEGSQANPWIIENWDINGTGYGYCIYVGNTTDYFVVRNSYLHEASGVSSWPFFPDSGIAVTNITNGLIQNNIGLDNTWYGIALDRSNNTSLANNFMSNNLAGIHLDNSHNNSLIANPTNNNSLFGIFLYYSDNTIVVNNICQSNGNNGIYMTVSNHNTILNNNCSSSINYNGISIDGSCDYNLIKNNICNDNANSGIYIEDSNSNTIENNKCSNNIVYDGISVVPSCDDNTIANNTCMNNRLGIGIWSSNRNILRNNSCSDNQNSGILLSSSDGNTLINSKCRNNGDNGIWVYNSNSNVIENNNCSNHMNYNGISISSSSDDNIIANNTCLSNLYNGIGLWSSERNILSNNTCKENGDSGIHLSSSGNNTIWFNIASNNEYGINLGSSYFNTIKGNIVANNTPWGILVMSSSNITIDSNTVADNDYGITLFSSLNSLIYHNNIINNTNQAWDDGGSNNSWDNGYPSGGNYWSDYAGLDVMQGPLQNVSGADWIGDVSYDTIIGSSGATDNYPLARPTIDGRVQHLPIRINSNANFDWAHGVVNWATGDGSEENPWIIENWDINGTGYGYCIYIGNTTNYFTVRECYLHEASGVNWWPFYAAFGVALFNVQNGTVSNNKASSNSFGILLYSSNDNIICKNNAPSNVNVGIYLYASWCNNIIDNSASYNLHGIRLYDSSYNSFENNAMDGDGFYILGNIMNHWNTHIIGTSNLVNGKPVYYWKNQTSGTVPLGAGQIILANCTEVVIEHQNIINGSVGIILGFSSNNILTQNIFSSNTYFGIYLCSSNNNIILNNTIENNNVLGLALNSASNNEIYHNNIIENFVGAYDDSTNLWDNGYPSGGNFWSDYTGTDNFSGNCQNETGSDGIGDTPYMIENSNQDNYPLMAPWTPPVDLSIAAEDITFSNPNPIPGEEITISAKIFNQKQDIVTFNIPVKLGWNFISVPLVQDDTSTMAVLDDNGGDTTWNVAKWYNALDRWDPWKTYRPGSTTNDLKDINHTIGIWLYITNVGTDVNLTVKGRMPAITTIPLWDIEDPEGWNMVGYPASNSTNLTAGNVKALTGYQVTEILTFEGSALGEVPVENFTSLNDSDSLIKGKAYWFKVSGNCTWAIDNGLPEKPNATATVSFYLGGIDEANLIDRQYDIQVPVYGSTTVTTNWTVNITGNHTIIVDVTDVDPRDINLLNNTAPKDFITASSFNIPILPGWNLISIPLEMADTSVSSVLASINGHWDVVKYYVNTDKSDPWKTYRVGSSLNDLTRIDNTMGFWIHATIACNLTVSGTIPVSTSIPLYAGWNLVGYPTLTFTESVANVFWGTGADRVEVCDLAEPGLIKEVGPTYIMKPGEGYWVHVSADAIWIVKHTIPTPNVAVHDISFSNYQPEKGEIIQINGVISNYGSGAIVDVKFYDGSENSENLIGTGVISVNSLNQSIAQIDWTATPGGIHAIFVTAYLNETWASQQGCFDMDLSDNYLDRNIFVIPNILLVDDDNHANDLSDGDTVSFMRASLEAADFNYDFVVIVSGDGPGYNYGDYPLKNYDIVIWMTGYEKLSTLTVNDQDNITFFLNNGGGSLWMIGQYLIEDGNIPYAFFNNILRTSGTVYNALGPTNPLMGVTGNPVSFQWNASYIPIATRVAGQGGSWRIIPDTNAEITFREQDINSTFGDAINYENIAKDSRLVFFPWEFSRIQRTSDQTQVAYRVLKWLGNITSKFTQDVAISEQTIEPETVFYKQQVTIKFVVRNNGMTDYTTADNLWYMLRILDTNGTDIVIPVLQRIDFLGINSNNALTVFYNWTPQQIGTYRISITVDPYNYINESNELNNEISSFWNPSELNVLYRILVVDDDDSLNNGGGPLAHNETQDVTNVLDYLGYNYEIFTTNVDWPGPGFGDCGNQTALDDYNAVIWVTGSAITPLMSLDIINITCYMEIGGNFWLLGNDIDTLGDPAFEQSYLKIASVDANHGMAATLRGVVNDSVSDGMAYACNGDANADILIPSAVGIGFTYQNDAMTYFNSVRYEGPTPTNTTVQYRSAVTAWGLSSLTDPLSRAEFVFLMLRWFDKP